MSTVREVLAMWLAISAALMYLDVPFWSSPLYATAIVIQSSLGIVIVQQLLKGTKQSLLQLFGPSLVLGGAVSFAIFELFGRGVTGIGISLTAGLISTIHLVKRAPALYVVESKGAYLVLLFGLVTLAMSSGYSWLIGTSCALLASGFILGSTLWRPLIRRMLAIVLVALGLALAGMTRGELWWQLSDDYPFLQTVANHLADSGPFARWGEISFLRYHWLSYGWSGLLDLVAMKPDPLIGLTRVMPLVYSLVFVSSLLLIARSITQSSTILPRVILVTVAVILSHRLDWSGTSTAGGLVVLTSLVAMLCLIVETQQPWRRRLPVYTIFGVLIILTKFPSVLALPQMVVGTEVIIRSGKWQYPRRLLTATAAVLAAGVLLLIAMPLIANIVGGFSIDWADKRGDELSQRGLVVQMLTLTARQSREMLIIALAWLVHLVVRDWPQNNSRVLLLSFTPFLIIGVIMSGSVNGNANTIDYFTAPVFLLSGTVMLALVPSWSGHIRPSPSSLVLLSILAGIPALLFVGIIAESVTLPTSINRAVPFLAPGYLAAAVSLVVLGLIASRKIDTTARVYLPLLIALLSTAAASSTVWTSTLIQDFADRNFASREIVSEVRPSNSEVVGRWIESHTSKSDLIATNHLRDADGYLSDYSLAMWSRREFLILGPGFLDVGEKFPSEIQLSLRFGKEPNTNDAKILMERGVRWFIIDTGETLQSDWDPYGDIVFKTDQFWVLKLQTPAAS